MGWTARSTDCSQRNAKRFIRSTCFNINSISKIAIRLWKVHLFLLRTCGSNVLRAKNVKPGAGGNVYPIMWLSNEPRGLRVWSMMATQRADLHHNRITCTQYTHQILYGIFFLRPVRQSVFTIFHQMKSVTVEKATVERSLIMVYSALESPFEYAKMYTMPVND